MKYLRGHLKFFLIVSFTLIFLIKFSEADTWSQTTKEEFAGNTLSNVDISTNNGEVGLSGAYSSDSNTVLLMHFDEGSGQTAADESSYGNHGTNNGATWTSDAKFGKALSFDGTDDYVAIPNSTSLATTGNFSVELWVKILSAQSGAFIARASGTYGGAMSYNLNWDSVYSRLYFQMTGTGGVGNHLVYTGQDTAPLNQFLHIAVTLDASNVNIYINGVLKASEARQIPALNNTGSVQIGKLYASTGRINAIIDEVRISNKTRSLGEMITPDTFPSSGTIVSQRINHGEPITNTKLDWKEIVAAYKDLWQVEAAFRTLKSELEMGPIYQRTEHGNRAHIFVCFLALLRA